MNKDLRKNIIRFLIAIILQFIVFQNIFTGSSISQYIYVFFYPIAILLLPIRTLPINIILLSFSLGIVIDLYEGSVGIHTSALVFMGFARTYVLRLIEPRKKYVLTDTPVSSTFGISWFILYCSILLGLHCFFYYSVDAFTFVFFLNILLKTILSVIASLLFIFIYQLIFNKG